MEAFKPKIPIEACPPTEEGPEEMDIRDQEVSTRITESRQPSIGQGGARKRKPSQDREPSKLIIRPSEHREDKARDEPSSGPKELIKKIGEKAKSVMRMSPPPERVQKVGEQSKS